MILEVQEVKKFLQHYTYQNACPFYEDEKQQNKKFILYIYIHIYTHTHICVHIWKSVFKMVEFSLHRTFTRHHEIKLCSFFKEGEQSI